MLPDGRTILVGVYGADRVAFVDTASRAVVASVAVPKPHTIAVRPDGKVAYVASQEPGQFALVVVDLATRAVGKQPHWMASDDKTVWVTHEGSNDVGAVDLASGKTTTIAVGNAPRKIVVQPAATKSAAAGPPTVSIANFAFAPSPVKVERGSAVTWINADGAPHALAFGDGTTPSDLLLPRQRFTRHYASAGTFDHVFSAHPSCAAR